MTTTITYSLNPDGTLHKVTSVADVVEDFPTVDEELDAQRDSKAFLTDSRSKINDNITELTAKKDALTAEISVLNGYIDELVILKNS